jgi:hypothetical protein
MSRPRIRTVKPDCWSDEALSPLSRDARLLFIVLVTFADDDGRFRDLPAQIIGHGYPEDPDVTPRKVNAWMDELVVSGVVVRYEVDGKGYGTFPKWHNHQRINRYSPSKLPPHPGREVAIVPHPTHDKPRANSVSDHGELTENSVSAHDKLRVVLTEGSPPEGKGREGSTNSARAQTPVRASEMQFRGCGRERGVVG